MTRPVTPLLRFITSDCNCNDKPWDKPFARPNPTDSTYWKPKYDTNEIQAYLHYKYEVERGTIFFSNHLNNQHINNIFVNNQSIRRIG